MHSKVVYTQSLVLPGTIEAVGRLCGQLLEQAKGFGYSEDEIFAIHLSLEEALTNAVRHGNQSDPNKTVSVEILISPEKFDISIADQGSGFNPDTLPDPRLGENLYKTEGRGVLLIKAYMDLIEYNDRGNCVHLIKYRGKSKSCL
jgi:serine/threonine-protein kinase RsbW